MHLCSIFRSLLVSTRSLGTHTHRQADGGAIRSNLGVRILPEDTTTNLDVQNIELLVSILAELLSFINGLNVCEHIIILLP